MNRDIAQYVLQLRDRVTRRQHHVLLVLACHHQTARETYWPTRENLALELQMDRSQLRRIIDELEASGILKHVPGVGAGNRSSYVFLEFEKGDVKGDKKGDFFDPLIRNYKTFTNTTSETLPNPPLQGGNRVTKRDLQKVQKQIQYNRARHCKEHPGCGLTQWGTCWGCYAEQKGETKFFPVDNDELRDACEELLLHYEDVRIALDEIQFPSLKKEPQRAAG